MPRLRKDGAVMEASADDVGFWSAQGWTPDDDAELYAAVADDAAKPADTGTLGAIKAGIEGVASGLSLGLTDMALASASTDNQLRAIRENRDAHSTVSTVSTIAGAVAPAFLSGGAATPAGALGRATLGAVETGRAIGGLRGAAQVVGAAGVEGAIQGAGSYLAETAIRDRELTAEGFSAAVGTGLLTGSVFGGAALGIEKGTIAARRLFTKASKKQVAAAGDEWTKASSEALDAHEQAATIARKKLDDARFTREQAELRKLEAEAQIAASKTIDAPPQAAAVVDDVAPKKLQAALSEFDDAKRALDEMKAKVSAGEIPGELGPFTPAGLEAAAQRELARRALPTHDVLAARKGEILESTIQPDELVKRGWYEMPGRSDGVRMDRVRKLVESGDAPPVKLNMSPSGKITVTDGRHRLAAAAELNVPIKARWSIGSEPAPSDLFRTGGPSGELTDLLERSLKMVGGKADEVAPVVADDLESQLAATLSAMQGGKSIKQLNTVEKIEREAAVVARYEKAATNLVEEIGAEAPPLARKMADEFRAAEAALDENDVTRISQLIDDEALSPQVARKQAVADIASAKAAEKAAAIDLRLTKQALSEKRRAVEASLVGAQDIPQASSLGMDLISELPFVGPLTRILTKLRTVEAAAGAITGRVPATKMTRVAAFATQAKERVFRAVDASLGLVEKTARGARLLTPAVVPALRTRIYDDGEPDAPKGASPSEIAAVRMREAVAAAGNPDAVAAAVRRQMRDVPDAALVDATIKHQIAKLQHLADKAPPRPVDDPLTKQPWQPSQAETMQWARRAAVANDPMVAFEMLEQRCLTPEAADTLRTVYPALFRASQERLMEQAIDNDVRIPYAQRVQNSLLFDVPLHPSMSDENRSVLKTAHEPTKNDAQPSFRGDANLNKLYQLPSDRRAMR